MGLFDRLKLLFGGTRKRDTSRLTPAAGSEGDDAGLDEVEETINLSGPLKEHHRRRALRDKRLLPKTKSVGRQLGITKRKAIIPFEEAERLFGGTQRTRNRKLRDLRTDEEQLRRYDLPVWKTEEEIARALGISLKALWFFSIHRERERQPHYVTFAVPKRSGGKRLIMAPKRRLKAIQRKLLQLLVEKLPVSEHAHGFRIARSIRTGAEPHVGRKFVLRLDLKDFFPSVTAARVRGLLIAYGYSFPVATTLAVLMTEAVRQPVQVEQEVFHVPVGFRHCVQGAPTSPGLCNSVVLRLDRRLAGLARKYGLAYTRYADDLSFSGDVERAALLKFLASARKIISAEGFVVNDDKTRIMGQGTRQQVTGVVVNQVLGVSRQQRRRLRAMIHRMKTAHEPRHEAHVAGKLAFVSMLNPGQAERLRTKT
jgi:RNA-directed DNA polymerase